MFGFCDVEEYLNLLGDLTNMAKGGKPSWHKQEGTSINVDKDSLIEDVDFEIVEDKRLLYE